jgi:hypothetical protein
MSFSPFSRFFFPDCSTTNTTIKTNTAAITSSDIIITVSFKETPHIACLNATAVPRENA